MLERWLNLLTKKGKLIIAVVALITLSLTVLLAHFASLTSRVNDYFDPTLAQPLRELEQGFGLGSSDHLTIRAADHSDVLSFHMLALQSQMFATIEQRWPVRVDSLVTLINQQIQALEKNEQARLDKLVDPAAVYDIIDSMYDADPEEFERVARKAISEKSAIDLLAESKLLNSLTAGFIAPAPSKTPPVEALRATISLKSDIDPREEREIFKEIRDFTDQHADKLLVQHYAPALVGVDIDQRVRFNSIFVIVGMFVLLGAILIYSFRSAFFTVLPLTILAVMLVWSFGIAWLGGVREFSFMTIVPIPLLLGQTIDNIIHFNERFRDELKRYSKRGALKVVLLTAGKAALLTTLINMAAFAADM